MTKTNDFLDRHGTAFLLVFIIGIAFILRMHASTYHVVLVPDYDGFQYLKISKYMANGLLIKEATHWTPLFPLLMTIFSFIPLPLDEIGSYINIIFGTLTIIPLYHMVRSLISREAGLVTVILYAVNTSIIWVNVQVMSESTYIFLLVLFGAYAAKIVQEHFTMKNGVICGVLGALIYYGRPEGILAYGALSVAMVFFNTNDPVNQRIKWLSVSAVVFLCLISPYVIFLKSQTGRWGLSAKVPEVMVLVRNALGIPQQGQGFIGTYFYDIQKTMSLFGKNLERTWAIIKEGLYYLLIFVPFYFFAVRTRPLGILKGILFLACMAAPWIASFIFHVDHRYFTPTMTIVLIPLSAGIAYVLLIVLNKKIFPRFDMLVIVVFAIGSGIYGYYCIYDIFEKNGEKFELWQQAAIYKTPGTWLRSNVPHGATLISSATNYLAAYYADMDYVNLSRYIEPEELIELMKKYSDPYLFIDEAAIRKYHKNLNMLLNPSSQTFKTSFLAQHLTPIYIDHAASVVVYRFLP